MKTLFIAIAALTVAFGATTWWALGSDGVAIVEPLRPEGGSRSTHVWYAEHDGEIWLEA